MKKAILIVLAFLAGVAIVFALGGIKFFQVRKAIAEYAKFSPPPESVTSVVAAEEEWVPSLKGGRVHRGGPRRDRKHRRAGNRAKDRFRIWTHGKGR